MCKSGIAEALFDQVVPRQRAQHVAIAGHAAADDQAIGRARHRHIEQPAVFVLGLAQHGRSRSRDRGRVLRLLAGPYHHARRMRRGIALRHPDQLQARGIGGRRRGVDQEHHRRFQPLGAMHGHDADFVARDFHVALHLGVGGAQPRHKTLQRGRRLSLVTQRQFEKFVQRVVGLMPEPPQDSRPAAVAAEQPGIERKRRFARRNARSQAFRRAKRGLEFVRLSRRDGSAHGAAIPCAAMPA